MQHHDHNRVKSRTGSERPLAAGWWERTSPLAAALGMLCLTGCDTLIEQHKLAVGPTFVPANVFRAEAKLPATLKRVVVLPLATKQPGSDMETACASLEPILLTELAKTTSFELVSLPPARLRHWSGRADWATTDRLPTNFFAQIRQDTGCDAVLFCELTQYRPYPPLSIGWRVQLVEATGPKVEWVFDDVFDASDAGVANAARKYHLARATGPAALVDPSEILNSPRRFGGYTAHALAATCPTR